MTFFEDQQDAWYANNCQGNIEDYDGTEHLQTDRPSRKQRSVQCGTSRQLLAVDRLEEFAAWAVRDGFKREETKGNYEVLRLRWEKQPPLLFFARNSTHAGHQLRHVTSQGQATQLVRRWIRERGRPIA